MTSTSSSRSSIASRKPQPREILNKVLSPLPSGQKEQSRGPVDMWLLVLVLRDCALRLSRTTNVLAVESIAEPFLGAQRLNHEWPDLTLFRLGFRLDIGGVHVF